MNWLAYRWRIRKKRFCRLKRNLILRRRYLSFA
ncbi:hypothetical protein Golob_025479 [Gossypium lobatum]|uniref:Uncharacterized protein n=1 Tax=Gossypium lobatum TaxID=34289 RepID=A0A7J8LS75_9ROSI|nr:hypothetical protein [Gossypium lobatum]